MKTAVTKFPRAVRSILLLRGLSSRAKHAIVSSGDHIFDRSEPSRHSHRPNSRRASTISPSLTGKSSPCFLLYLFAP